MSALLMCAQGELAGRAPAFALGTQAGLALEAAPSSGPAPLARELEAAEPCRHGARSTHLAATAASAGVVGLGWRLAPRL